MKRRESPIKRTNPSGREVWVARYTRRDGKRRSAGTYQRKHEAQNAIDAAYTAEDRGATRDARVLRRDLDQEVSAVATYEPHE